MSPLRSLKLGIVGCGAIGSRIAMSVRKELKNKFLVSALYDIDTEKAFSLSSRLRAKSIVKTTLAQLIQESDLVLECVNSSATVDIVRQSIRAGKNIMVMSIGRLSGYPSVFTLARKNGISLLLPSGSIAGLDAVKAATLAGKVSATLTTRKPPAGFLGNAYLVSRKISLEGITKEKLLFDGNALDAVRRFPQNINVAAVLRLALGPASSLRVRIIADPSVKSNIHEIVLDGPAGRVVTRTENNVCPDNPKTSYLAVLSGIQTLKQYFDCIKIGT
jgi:aspartate dehydrogenase